MKPIGIGAKSDLGDEVQMSINIFKMGLKTSQVTLTFSVVLVWVSLLPSLDRAQGKGSRAGSLFWKVVLSYRSSIWGRWRQKVRRV